MDYDLDLSGLTDFQSCVDQPRDMFQVHDTGFAKNGLGSDLGDLIDDLFGSFLASLRDIVDHDIGATFSKLKSNASTNSPLQALAHGSRLRGVYGNGTWRNQ